MNAMTPSHARNTAAPLRKRTTLTALAAACTVLLSAPALAAPTQSTASGAQEMSAPSAIDSSRRIIRLSNSSQTPAATSEATATASAAPDMMTDDSATMDAGANVLPAASNGTAPWGIVAEPNPVPGRVYMDAPRPSAPPVQTRSTPRTSTQPSVQLANVPTPQISIADVSFVPTVMIAQKQGLGTDKLDVSLLDDFINDVSPNARHYPPNFPNRSQRHYTREKIKAMATWIDEYASAPNASYDVLLRAAKLNGMGRNLDLGSEYAVRGGNYIDRAIKLKPDSGEANFLYGMMLAEGGGFKEGKKYLDRAVSLGYVEAEQSLAQSDLLSDRRSEALERLRRLEAQYPNNDIIRKQIQIVEDGKYYIWDIPAPNVNVKPTT
ncbi:tetratricopeptide repeat protein [Psychrobacter aestuarii]|uniref:Sel1 repeat family protein n=1 Tax=Psychrobacter aestuarii TaxID=556327 RepID=A0ABP3FQV3_9GAMM|nr:hypothetical protein [Psychrobacter aestuarii]